MITMKKPMFVYQIMLIVLSFSFLTPAHSQKPEKVYSIVKTVKPFDWYLSQAVLWKKEIDQNRKNADAWLNFYTANRMAGKINKEAWEKKKGPGYMETDEIVKEMEKEVPGSFEYNYVRTWNDGFRIAESEKYLFKAYELDPGRPEIYGSLVNYYEMRREKGKEEEICKKWFNSNEMSPGLLNYNYNVLQSLEDNSIIITNGDNDTYPLWILQYASGLKKSVMVVNIHLIMVESYRKKLFAENNIPEFIQPAEEQELQKAIINHLISQSGRTVYFANTLSPGYYTAFEKDLYIVGLVFRYSKENFDNIAVARNNYEKNYLLDYLRIDFRNDESKSVMNSMNMGYIPLFIKLYNHYRLSGESEKAKEIKQFSLIIAKNGDPEANVEEWFSGKN